MEGNRKSNSNLIGSVRFLDSILELLHEKGNIGVTEAADELERPKSTVHKYLKTMETLDMVENHGGTYSLSLRVLEFGGRVRDDNVLFKEARPEVEELAREIDELINIWVRHGDFAVRVYNSKERYGIENLSTLGERIYLHQNTAGKAMLAEMSTSVIKGYVERTRLPSAMSKTVSSFGELIEELEAIRENGYSVGKGERFEGTRAISASIYSKKQNDLGALSIVIPVVESQENKLEDKYSNIITRVASNINLNMKYKNSIE